MIWEKDKVDSWWIDAERKDEQMNKWIAEDPNERSRRDLGYFALTSGT